MRNVRLAIRIRRALHGGYFIFMIMLATASSSAAGMIVGGPLNGTSLPGSDGGMVIGGPFNGTKLPGYGGGMIVGGPMDGTLIPAYRNVALILFMYLTVEDT